MTGSVGGLRYYCQFCSGVGMRIESMRIFCVRVDIRPTGVVVCGHTLLVLLVLRHSLVLSYALVWCSLAFSVALSAVDTTVGSSM